MVKTLQKHGNSQALVIEKALMDALGIEADTPLQVTVTGNSLIVTPVNVGVEPEEVSRALEKLRPRYGEMLQRLAESRLAPIRFLSVNGAETLPAPDALEEMTMRGASGGTDKAELIEWMRNQLGQTNEDKS